jgi:hypothetical protein
MIVLTLIIFAAVVLPLIIRLFGFSRWLTFGLSIFPSFCVFGFFLIRRDIELGPHGGFPAWMISGIVFGVCLFFSGITVITMSDKS